MNTKNGGSHAQRSVLFFPIGPDPKISYYTIPPHTQTHTQSHRHTNRQQAHKHTHTHTPHPHTLQSQKPNTLHTKLKFQSKKIKSYSRKAQCMLYKLSFFLETSLLFGSFLSPGGPKCRDLFHFPHVLECFIAVLDCFRKTF